MPVATSVLYWNKISLDVFKADWSHAKPDGSPDPAIGGPTATSRALAIVHIAMYDALQRARTAGIGDAERDATVAGAAASALSRLLPRETPFVNASLATFICGDLAAFATTSPDLLRASLHRGDLAARGVLAAREGDGSARSEMPQVLIVGPGMHKVDPWAPADQAQLGPSWGDVRPFCLPQNWQLSEYLADHPPLASQAYADDYDEVKRKGSHQSLERSPEELETGIFWAYDGALRLATPPRLYNQCVRAVLEAHGDDLTIEDHARLFALVNAGMADAGIVSWRGKYFYNLWRPVVGIRHAASGPTALDVGDGNPGTAGDAFWAPFGVPRTNQPGLRSVTPNFPAYPSGHATFGTTCFELVRRFFAERRGKALDDVAIGDVIGFEVQSDELNGICRDSDGSVRTPITRAYTLNGAIKDNIKSRVYLGVHWRFDGARFAAGGEQVDYASKIGGAGAGYHIAKAVFETCFRDSPARGSAGAGKAAPSARRRG